MKKLMWLMNALVIAFVLSSVHEVWYGVPGYGLGTSVFLTVGLLLSAPVVCFMLHYICTTPRVESIYNQQIKKDVAIGYIYDR